MKGLNVFRAAAIRFGLVCVFSGTLAMGEHAAVVRVWPGEPPAWDAPMGEETSVADPQGGRIAGRTVTRTTNVTTPELFVYPASDANGKPSKTVVVICPGGGFHILAWDLEGTEVAEQLQAGGVTAVVLKYRVPTASSEPRWKAPLQDIQRTLAIVRAGKVTGDRPTSVGVMGFSAGGHASARAATSVGAVYESVDESDREIMRPDFACLIYPAWLVRENDPDELVEGLEVDPATPPMFLAHAEDDKYDALNSVTIFRQLHAAGVPAALHIFTRSGHGFGARVNEKADDAWPELCLAWLRDEKFLAR